MMKYDQTKIEKVARGLAVARGHDPDAICYRETWQINGYAKEPHGMLDHAYRVDGDPFRLWTLFIPDAELAIELAKAVA